MVIDATAAGPSPEARMERLPQFVPTPEVLGDLLQRDIETIRLQILEGQNLEDLAQDVTTAILDRRIDFRESFPNIDWDNVASDTLESELRTWLLAQLDQEQMLLREDAEALVDKAKRLESIEDDPEKKGLFSRALDAIRNLGWKGKILVALLVIALAAGGVAGGFALAGKWEALMSFVGAAAENGAAGAAGAMEILEEAGALGEVGASVPSEIGL